MKPQDAIAMLSAVECVLRKHLAKRRHKADKQVLAHGECHLLAAIEVDRAEYLRNELRTYIQGLRDNSCATQ